MADNNILKTDSRAELPCLHPFVPNLYSDMLLKEISLPFFLSGQFVNILICPTFPVRSFQNNGPHRKKRSTRAPDPPFPRQLPRTHKKNSVNNLIMTIKAPPFMIYANPGHKLYSENYLYLPLIHPNPIPGVGSCTL